MDFNQDGFLDLPVSDQFQIFNRYRWMTKTGFRGQFGVKYLEENSQSGQLAYTPVTDRLSTRVYGVEMDTRRWEAFNKLGYVFKNNPASSFGSVVSFTHHNQETVLGQNQYSGLQNSLYAKALFSTSWGQPEHKLTTGLSYKHDDYEEAFNDSAFTRQERVPGAFVEYSYNKLSRLIYTLGARIDFHNLYGTIFTPRAHLKYDLAPNTTLRLSGGSGFRVPNPVADNMSMLISGRRLQVPEAL
jgi:outer membrane receptor for ferrienterochelin and colicin